VTDSNVPLPSSPTPKYAWRLLRAGPLRLDGGSMFGVVPRALWSREVPFDDQGRIELAHNCLLLQRPMPDQSSIPVGSASRTVSPPLAGTVRSADPTKSGTGGAERILIETGSGNKFDPKSRRIFGLTDYWIADALAEAGCRREDVTHAIVTHLHFDHAGGLTCRADGGEAVAVPSFPNATIYVQRREWDDALVNNSVMTRTYLPENLEPIREQVRLIESPLPFPPGYHPRRDEPPMVSAESRMLEILPGIRVLAVPGHTWGQQAVLFTDEQDRTVVFPADLLPTAHHVGAAYNMAYDVEPYTSTVTRRWFLEAAAANDWLLVLDHEAGNPCQRVKAEGKGWFKLEAVNDCAISGPACGAWTGS
jgi:glyoxylase-like metal-dependent hydrolase (beta-lactamase superfamily II)